MPNLQGLLNPGMLMDLGTGLLSQSGWSATPQSMGQAMGGAMQFANSRQADRLAMEAARQKIEQEKKKTDAMNQIQGLLAVPPPTPGQVPGVPAIQTPAGQAQLLGLLGQAAPDMLAQSLATQLFQKPEAPRYTSDMNEFMAVSGLQPGSPGFMEGYTKFLSTKAGAEADPVQGQLLQAQLAQSQVELANALEERAARQNQAATDKRQTQLRLGTDLEHLVKIAERTEKLEGTILETGLPLGDFRRGAVGFTALVQDLAGRDSAKAKELTQAHDDLNKLLNDFTMDTASRFSNGAMTDSKLSMLSQSFASMKANPGTNLMVVGDTINGYLDAAEIDGITIPNADKYRALAAKLLGEESEDLTPTAETPSIITSGQPMPSMPGPLSLPTANTEAELDAQIEQMKAQLRKLGVVIE
jgi:hypothetical protein